MHEEKLASTRTTAQKVGLVLGPVLFFLMLLLDLEPGKPIVTRMAAVATLMAVWWITDAIPLSATALLPMVLYPLLGILIGASLVVVNIINERDLKALRTIAEEDMFSSSAEKYREETLQLYVQ